MTANGRPNLGGLFSGTTPPDRSSSIADALDPRSVGGDRPGDRAQSARSAKRSPGGAPQTPAAPATGPARAAGPRGEAAAAAIGDRRIADPLAAIQWLDPMRALGQYFDFVQGLLDAQRRVTMSVAAAVTAPVRRLGVWR